MRKTGKKFAAARQQVPDRAHTNEDANPLMQKVKFAKFDETVEIAMRLGVDPKHADQMVRGTVVLPHGLGKTKRVLAIAGADKQRDAQAACADFVGGEELVDKIQGGWMDFDAVVATPDIAKAVKEIKAGKVEFRVDKTGIIHAPVGKVSFAAQALIENTHALVDSVVRAKPSAAKGKFLKSVTLSSTMGPGITIDTSHVSETVKH
jgi:large subunit ribosomal protein L1